MKKLVILFKSLTAIHHFLVFLIILTLLKVINVFIEKGPYDGSHFLQLGLALIVVSILLFSIFRYVFDKNKNYLHALISTLLILLILSHDSPSPVRGGLVILLLYVSKFMVKYKNQNIFNPVIFALGSTTLIALLVPGLDIPPVDWSGIDIRFTIIEYIIPLPIIPIILSAYFNVGRINKHPLLISFITTLILTGFITNAYVQNPFSYILIVAFFGVAIITEPKTSPIKTKIQIIYGVILALIITVLILFQFPNPLIIGLMIGNGFYFIYKTKIKQLNRNTNYYY